MPGRLNGKVAIVTGAAPVGPGVGNGKAIAILFAREGARVVLVNRTRERADDLRRDIEDAGGECAVVTADVTQHDQVSAMVGAAVDRFGRLDVLVNNVGCGGPGTVVNVTERVWEDALAVNLNSVMWCCRHAIPMMMRTGGGSIVNVSTVAAVQGFRRAGSGFAAYAAAKAGVLGLTRAMAADHAADGIRVNALIVGLVHTPRLEQFGEEARERRRLAVPLGTEGTGWDVAWGAVYLASDEARWVTGTELTIDGGQTAVRDWP